MNEGNTQIITAEVIPPSALEVMERAQTDMQIATAKRYPREMSVVKKKMLSLATLDEETAATCFYALSRRGAEGNKEIIGPSVRLAEIAVNSFGNIKAASRVIGNDGKMITAQAVCHDLEQNVCISVEVKRRITTKLGATFSDDMQVVTGNAACAIALRNAIFKVVPMALIKPAFDAARRVAVGDGKTLASRRAEAMKIFEGMGVSKERVYAAIEVKGMEDISLEKLEILIGLHTAIKDNDTTVDQAFPPAVKSPSIISAAPSILRAGAGVKDKEKLPETPAEDDPLLKVRKLLATDGIQESDLINYLRGMGTIEETLISLEQVALIEPSVLTTIEAGWKTISSKLSNKKKK